MYKQKMILKMTPQNFILGLILAAYSCSAKKIDPTEVDTTTTTTTTTQTKATEVQAECIADLTTTSGKKEGLETISSGVEMCRLPGEIYQIRGKFYLIIPEGTISGDRDISYSLCSVGTDNKPACLDGGFRTLNQGKKVETRYVFDDIRLKMRRSLPPDYKVEVTISIPEKDGFIYSQEHYLNE